MNKHNGFTLIELVMVIVIIGILAAIAVPRFVDLQGAALTAAIEGTEGATRSALTIAIADLRGYPTLDELVTYVQTDNGPAVVSGTGNGVQVAIDGTDYVIRTYTDPNCTAATNAGANTVRCVGSVAP